MNQVDPIRQRWALLVGINKYIEPSFPSLRFAVNDARTLETLLQGLGYTTLSLHDEAEAEHLLPTRPNIEAELQRLCQLVSEDDLLLVYYAGHGKIEAGVPLLVTREVRRPIHAKNALPLSVVEELLRASRARQKVLFLDACHLGVEMGERDLPDDLFIQQAHEMAQGFALLAASTAQQTAIESGEFKHGVFTHFALDGLRGKAARVGRDIVTFNDLETYVLTHLRDWSFQHPGVLQESTKRMEGMGDPLLADYRDRTRPTLRVLNFSTYALTARQQEQIQIELGEPVAEFHCPLPHLDHTRSLEEQIRTFLDQQVLARFGLTHDQLQGEPLVINLPGFAPVTATLLAELHGRIGYFPTVLHIAPVGQEGPQRYEVAEVINLQRVQNSARQRR